MKRQWLLINNFGVCENINVVRSSKIHIFDRVDVCNEYFKMKSHDIKNDKFSILLVYDKIKQ